ncbi:3-ketoacyl-CoA synthase 11-like [Dorcoceras hygrometricum]|uniref:3-ketoacyl-CoA synthase 11-like n=1 Tax=Dorcoceras hygrometricum TaxID=472368 RepID=A0A2Z7BBF2_9LAMI|nr:3-ketoacyl-CoA synthase 11-like [Dorcoceras hygrometricum]
MPPSSSRKLPDFKQSTFSIWDVYFPWDHLRFNFISVLICSTLSVFVSTVIFLPCPRPVYLVNFSCYKPDEDRKWTRKIFMERSEQTGLFTDSNLEFQLKILERSGLGESTYLPEAVFRVPPNPCMAEARKEAETVMYGAIDELLAKSTLKPKDVGIWIVKCSNWYFVNERSMLVMEDPNGKVGVAPSKHLMAVAGDAIKPNIRTLVLLISNWRSNISASMPVEGLSLMRLRRIFSYQIAIWSLRITLYPFGNTLSSSLWYELTIWHMRKLKEGSGEATGPGS